MGFREIERPLKGLVCKPKPELGKETVTWASKLGRVDDITISTYMTHYWRAETFFPVTLLSTHNDAPQSVGLLRTSVPIIAVTSSWQHTTLTTGRHPCLRRHSNPQSQ